MSSPTVTEPNGVVMSSRIPCKTRLACFLIVIFVLICQTCGQQPNFIIIFTDDQGYNDLGCFGSKRIKTPNIDKLAAEGRKFTSFYVPCSVCSPSRAALLTGCYPKRIGMEKHVVFPQNNWGLNPDELTIAEVLTAEGYATACVGKWHLGHRKQFLPTNQGFDSYFGIPYSNDMNHPDNKGKPKFTMNETWLNQDEVTQAWNTPLMENEKIVELPVNQRTITRRYTDRAIEFVRANQDKPFFLYLPHSMPHIPLFVPEDAFDSDPKNAYKAVIEHIDAEVGRLVDEVRKLNLANQTYVIYTSDNGPWLPFLNHGGSALPLKNGKGSTYEGGHRVPCVMWAPGRIPANSTTDEFVTSMDLFPTISRIVNAKTKPSEKIDGLDIGAVIHGDAKSPRAELVYYSPIGLLHGLRQNEWKLRIAKKRPRKKEADKPQKPPTVELYNLAKDISESNNLAEQMPEKVEAMRARMIELDKEITDNVRPRGQFKMDAGNTE